MTRKLGKHPTKHDSRTLKMARYLPIYPPPPEISDWSSAVDVPWRDFLNTNIGDCTIAGAGHLIMLWSANASDITVPEDHQIIEAYSAVTGFDPRRPDTDNGAAELDVLKFWRNDGIAGHKITAFVGIDPRNAEQIRAAIHLFGGIYIGVSMPDSWQRQLDADQAWSWHAGDRANPYNGHALPIVGYDPQFLTCVTWGQKQDMTWEWFNNCCDEAYAILSPDWILGPNAPSGLNLAELQNDLNAL